MGKNALCLVKTDPPVQITLVSLFSKVRKSVFVKGTLIYFQHIILLQVDPSRLYCISPQVHRTSIWLT